jgi:tetratricopeptide (TPR) repeat protein
MGIYSGPVSAAKDMGGSISGKAIEISQCLMRVGDSDHILLSQSVADVLLRVSAWTPQLHNLGDHEVGGVKLRIFTLVAGGVGKFEQPKLLPSREVTSAPPRAGRTECGLLEIGEPGVLACLEDARAQYAATFMKDLGGHFDIAILRFTEVIRLQPDCPDAYAGRARSYSALGRNAEAVEDYDESLRLRPRVPQFYLLRASARDASGDPTGTLADLNEALRLDPCCADAYSQRAGLMLSSGDLPSAIEDCSEALRLHPDDAAAYRR